MLLGSNQRHEAEPLDEGDYAEVAAEADDEPRDERFDDEDYYPLQDDHLYDEGKHVLIDGLFIIP